MVDEEHRMSFGEHLEELRRRIIISLVGTAVFFAIALAFQDELYEIIQIPFDRAADALEAAGRSRPTLQVIEPTEGFLFYMKICIGFAMLCGSPLLLNQMWKFIAAGLYPHERKAVMRIMPFSLIMLLAGMGFGFNILLPYGLEFLLGYVDEAIEVPIRLNAYFSFLMAVTLVMGFLFQLPLVMTVCSRTGLISVMTFTKYRRHFIVGAFVLAAFVTPPDPGTQVMVGIPILFLYEFGVFLARGAEKKRLAALEGASEETSPMAIPEAGPSKVESRKEDSA